MPSNRRLRTIAAAACVALSGLTLSAVTVQPAAAATDPSKIVSAAHGQLGSDGCGVVDCTVEWCAEFSRWAWQQGGVDVSTLGATVTTFVNYGDNNKTWHDPSGYTPKPGDAMIFGGSGFPTKASGGAHVGIVESVNSDGTITEIGGNQGGHVTEVTGTAASIEAQLEGSSYNFLGYVSPLGVPTTPPAPTVVGQGSINSGTFNLLASDTDPSVTSVTFKVDGTTLGTATNGPQFSLPWNTTTVADGTHQVTAVATNAQGTSTASQPATFTIHNLAASWAGSNLIYTSDDRVVMYKVGSDGNVWGDEQGTVHGAFTGWTQMSSGIGFTGNVAAILKPNGDIALFARTTDGFIYGLSKVNGAWAGSWVSVGGSGTGVAISDPSPVLLNDGTIAVYATNAGNNVIGTNQSVPNGSYGSWVAMSSGIGLTGRPGALARPNGDIALFARTTDGFIYGLSKVNGAWAGSWVSVGGSGTGVAISDPSPVLLNDGTIAVYATNAGNNVIGTNQSVPKGSYGSWVAMSSGIGLTGRPGVLRKADGTLALFARTTDGFIYVLPNTNGGSWGSVGGSGTGVTTSDPVALQGYDNLIAVYAQNQAGNTIGTTEQAVGGTTYSSWIVI